MGQPINVGFSDIQFINKYPYFFLVNNAPTRDYHMFQARAFNWVRVPTEGLCSPTAFRYKRDLYNIQELRARVTRDTEKWMSYELPKILRSLGYKSIMTNCGNPYFLNVDEIAEVSVSWDRLQDRKDNVYYVRFRDGNSLGWQRYSPGGYYDVGDLYQDFINGRLRKKEK